jgi:hypothetical protein
LQEARLQADIKKSEFNVNKIMFLDLIVSLDSLEIDLDKIKTVLEWEQPQNLIEVQGFIGFYNFYHWFIKGFSKLVKLLTELSKKENKTTSIRQKSTKQLVN